MATEHSVQSGSPAIEIRDVYVTLDGTKVLEAIDLSVSEHEFLGIIGPNGGGKTVLLKLLLGLIEPTRGTVRVLGGSPRQARGQVGYVPQHTELDRRFPIRVLDVVQMGRLGQAAAGEDRPRALDALEKVKLGALADRQIGKLSGGQLQRVLIARALAMNARVLLLDEPMANLDSPTAGEILELLARLADSMSIVMVEHDVGVLSRYVQSVACLNRRIHCHGAGEPTQEMLEKTYGYPVEVLVHGHRLLEPHDGEGRG